MNCSRCGHHQDAHGHVSNICPDHRGFFSPAVTAAPAVPAPGAGGRCGHCGADAYHKDGCITYLAKCSQARQVEADPAPAAPGSPAEPGEPLFVAIKSAVMAGKDHVATACSKTMAKRIAAALNKARKGT